MGTRQVVTLVLDVLDQDVLSGIDVDISILGITISLTSVDNVFKTLDSVNGIKGLAGGDLKNLNFNAVKGEQTRAKTGDLQLVYKALIFSQQTAHQNSFKFDKLDIAKRRIM
ncbi:MAG: hypothetical protein E7522_05880 [Ruminococcaceae bacterium]|nr:hypothetical protein [Oscillospiraceae bacterium]